MFEINNLLRFVVKALVRTPFTFKAFYPSADDLALFQKELSSVKFTLLGFNVDSAAGSLAWHKHSRNLNLQQRYLFQPLVQRVDQSQSWLHLLSRRFCFKFPFKVMLVLLRVKNCRQLFVVEELLERRGHFIILFHSKSYVLTNKFFNSRLEQRILTF